MKVGIIGAGAISQFLMNELKGQPNLQVTSLLVRNEEKYRHLATINQVELFSTVETFLQADVDIVVEAADIQAVRDLVPTI